MTQAAMGLHEYEVMARIVTILVEREVLTVTVWPDQVEVCGGHDSDTVVFTIPGEHTRAEVAGWFGVDPSHITEGARDGD